MGKLTGKTAIITGAAVGLGFGIAEVYAKYGANICMVDISDKVNQSAETIRQTYNTKVITVIADVRELKQLKEAAEKTIQQFGRIDIACCNAGICKMYDFLDMTDEIRDQHIDINIKGVWNTCKAVIPNMLSNGGGNIVIASSVTGDIVADPGESAYALSKAALVGFTKALAIEFAEKNIRVNCTQLGFARTPMSEFMAKQTDPDNVEAIFADMAKGIPVKRLAKPKEVGELFAFLGSDESSYLTGSQIVIDGAATIRESNMGV